jgi:hypothetical protein
MPVFRAVLPSVMHDDQFIETAPGMRQQALEELALSVNTDNQGNSRHSGGVCRLSATG